MTEKQFNKLLYDFQIGKIPQIALFNKIKKLTSDNTDYAEIGKPTSHES